MSAVIGLAILTFVFAYIAIQTPEKHGPLQIGHYILIHVMAFFTITVAYASNSSSEEVATVLSGLLNPYSNLIYLVGAYFGIYMLVKALKFFGDSGE